MGKFLTFNFAKSKIVPIFAIPKRKNGALAERLGTGLQNLLERFDSARHLQKRPLRHFRGRFVFMLLLNCYYTSL